MLVLQLLLKHLHDNNNLPRFLVVSVKPFMAILGNMHVLYILSITVVCVAINDQKCPKVCGNPLAALGCQLVEGVLYVSKLPVTADGK